MAVNLDNIAEKIMKFIRGNGLQVKMFDSDSGKSVADPSVARYFYVDEPNMMIVLDDKEKTIKFHMGEEVSLKNPMISKMHRNLKKMAVDHMLDFDIRSFGKRIEPKGYGYKIEQNKERDVDEVFESISKLEGSTRTSRQQLENAKIIVRHKKPVNEENRGARSRNISAIFIENGDGERFKYPYKHLSGARAMARHISSGGNPMDMAGSAIVEMSTSLYKLQEFMGIVNKQQLVNETNRDIVLNVKRKMESIKENIKRIQGSKGYTSFIESLALNETAEEEISEDTINAYVSKFTKSTFEESLKDILPLIHKVNEEEYNSNRGNQIEKVMGIIMAKDAEGNKVNTISFPNRSSYDFANIKKQYQDDKGSQYAKIAAAYEDLASRVDVDSTDDKKRKNKGHDRAAIISLFLADISEKLNSNPKSITKPEQQLASYFMKMSQRPAVGESLEEKKTFEQKIDTMVMETFSKFKDVFETYGINEEDTTMGSIEVKTDEERAGRAALFNLRKIVDEKQARSIKLVDGSMKVDMFTASAIINIYDAVNDANKAKLIDMLGKGKAGMLKVADIAMKLHAKNESAISEGASTIILNREDFSNNIHPFFWEDMLDALIDDLPDSRDDYPDSVTIHVSKAEVNGVEESINEASKDVYAMVSYDYKDDWGSIELVIDNETVEDWNGYFGANETGNPLAAKFVELCKKHGIDPTDVHILSGNDEDIHLIRGRKSGYFDGEKFQWNESNIGERKLTGGEKRSREANVKKLKKHKGDFEDTYGKDKGEQVMYAVATKRAKEKK